MRIALRQFRALVQRTRGPMTAELRLIVWLSIGMGGLLSGNLVAQSPPPTTAIAVILRDESGRPVAGADVVLKHTGGTLEHATTGQDGRASFANGGDGGVLSIHQAGYVPVDQPVDSDGRLGAAVELALIAAPQSRETVTVQADPEEISEQSASSGESINSGYANESPMRPITLTDALPLVPGVVRAPNGQTQIEGAGEMHSALLINSVDTTDPATGRFGLSVPIDVVDSVHVLTSPYLAQYGRFTAGVVTAETKPAGNKWHYDLNDPLPEFRIRSGHLRGLKSATPRLSFGGPLVADRLSFTEGLEVVDNKLAVRTLYFPDNETKIRSVNSFTQADLILTARQTLSASLHIAPQSTRYANLDYFRPQEVTPNDETQAFTGTISHRLALGQALLQSTLAASDIGTSVSPQGTFGMMVSPTGDSGNYFAMQNRHARRFEWNEMWSLQPVQSAGTHMIQLGSSLASTEDEGHLQAKTITLADAQGVKLRTIDFIHGSMYDRIDQQPAVFAQDHWTARPNLAFDAGIRAEAQSITSTTRIAPRIGFLWTPSTASPTSVSGGVGTFYDSVPLNVYSFNSYPQQVITTFAPNGSISDGPRPYLNLTAESSRSDFPLVDQEQKVGNFAPYTVAWNIQFQHRFSERLTMRAKYLESRGTGLITLSSKNVQGQDAFVLAGDGSSHYRQFEVTAQLSLQAGSRIYASYVRSESRGSLNESDTYLGDYASPFIRNNLYTNRSGDIPNRFLTWGNLTLPGKVNIFPMVEWRSGFPYQPLDVYQNYIQGMEAESPRFPGYFASDARVAKDVKVNAKYTLRPSVSVTNITNHFNALEVHANSGDPLFGRFFGNYDRHERFDLDLLF